MAKPIAVQKLRHGKALCGKTFGGFVDTFNWLVDFCLSLQGDKDANNANGSITVDRSNESAPVIRLAATKGGAGYVAYVAGDDTNITFRESTDQSDARYGKIMIDVYYV